MHDLRTRTANPGAIEDNEITEGLRGGPDAQNRAINRAYDRYAKPLAGYIRERVAPTLDSDEVATAVNDAFCALARYAAKRRFDDSAALSTLLFTLARRKAIDQLRGKTSRKRRPAPLVDGKVDGAAPCPAEMTDEEFAACVAQRLLLAPEIAASWRTAADEAAANEIIRTFRLWIGTLPRVQRKVAQALLTHFGSATDAEIAVELAQIGERATAASVKSARAQIVRKFTDLIEHTERTRMHDTRKRQSST